MPLIAEPPCPGRQVGGGASPTRYAKSVCFYSVSISVPVSLPQSGRIPLVGYHLARVGRLAGASAPLSMHLKLYTPLSSCARLDSCIDAPCSAIESRSHSLARSKGRRRRPLCTDRHEPALVHLKVVPFAAHQPPFHESSKPIRRDVILPMMSSQIAPLARRRDIRSNVFAAVSPRLQVLRGTLEPFCFRIRDLILRSKRCVVIDPHQNTAVITPPRLTTKRLGP